MELSSRFVGTPLKDYHAEIASRQTMNFAAAVDDNNDYYMDDEREGGIIAPPMFSVAVTWRILERIWEYIEAKDFPMEVLVTQVHHTEALEFHRPLPGLREWMWRRWSACPTGLSMKAFLPLFDPRKELMSRRTG
jgi:N-terminal half of MaoC dehydratase